MAVMAPQRARTCFLGFVFLAVATLPALWAAAEQRPNDQELAETSTTLGSLSAGKGAPVSQSGASYFSEAAKLIHSDLDDNDASALYAALGRDTVELMAAEADPRESIENQPVLAQLESGLWSVLKGLAPIPSVKPDIATIHLGAGDRGSEDLILFGLGNVPGLSIVAIHRIGEKYTVLPSTALLAGRFVRDPSGQLRVPHFADERVRALDVTGDGIKEAIAEFGNYGSAGAVNVDVLRWVGGNDFFKPIFSMTLSGWIGPPCDYRFVPAGSAQDIEVTLPIVGIFDNRDQHLADTSLWRYDTAADRFVKRSESIESPETARQQVNAAEVLLRQGKLPDAVRAYQRAWSDTSLTEHEELFPGADFRGFRAPWMAGSTAAQGGPVSDVIYTGLTIVVFAALFLLVMGVERIER